MSGVETNLRKSGNNFWLMGHTDANKIDSHGVKLRKMLNPKIVRTPFTRINLERMDWKKLNGFMSDGTATNVSDPSSMIDQGATRNAIYHVEIYDGGQMPRRSTSSQGMYRSFLQRDGTKNHAHYSFGGASKVRSVLPGQDLHNEFLHSASGSLPNGHFATYYKEPLVRVNDYTKNISQSVFSPGLMQDPEENVKKLFREYLRGRKGKP